MILVDSARSRLGGSERVYGARAIVTLVAEATLRGAPCCLLGAVSVGSLAKCAVDTAFPSQSDTVWCHAVAALSLVDVTASRRKISNM